MTQLTCALPINCRWETALSSRSDNSLLRKNFSLASISPSFQAWCNFASCQRSSGRLLNFKNLFISFFKNFFLIPTYLIPITVCKSFERGNDTWNQENLKQYNHMQTDDYYYLIGIVKLLEVIIVNKRLLLVNWNHIIAWNA